MTSVTERPACDQVGHGAPAARRSAPYELAALIDRAIYDLDRGWAAAARDVLERAAAIASELRDAQRRPVVL